MSPRWFSLSGIWPSSIQSNGSLNMMKIRNKPFMLLKPKSILIFFFFCFPQMAIFLAWCSTQVDELSIRRRCSDSCPYLAQEGALGVLTCILIGKELESTSCSGRLKGIQGPWWEMDYFLGYEGWAWMVVFLMPLASSYSSQPGRRKKNPGGSCYEDIYKLLGK